MGEVLELRCSSASGLTMAFYALDEHCTDLLCQSAFCVERAIRKLVEIYRERLYSYNSTIKGLGYYLKPTHMVTKRSSHGRKTYIYLGRYWYKLVKSGSKIRWIYVGLEKPLKELPDPPLNPLLVIKFARGPEKSQEEPQPLCLCVIATGAGSTDERLAVYVEALVNELMRCKH